MYSFMLSCVIPDMISNRHWLQKKNAFSLCGRLQYHTLAVGGGGSWNLKILGQDYNKLITTIHCVNITTANMQ